MFAKQLATVGGLANNALWSGFWKILVNFQSFNKFRPFLQVSFS